MSFKNKKTFLLIGMILLGAVLVLWLSLYRPTVSPQKTSIPFTPSSWKAFHEKNPPFDFSFEYPTTWKMSTSQFSGKFDMVSVLGPQDTKTKFSVSIFIVKKSAPFNQTGAQIAENVLSGKKRFLEFELIKKGNQQISAGTVPYIEYQYVSLLPLYAPEKQRAVILNRELFLIRKNFYYQISFVGTREQYKTFLPFFEHTLETLHFTD